LFRKTCRRKSTVSRRDRCCTFDHFGNLQYHYDLLVQKNVCVLTIASIVLMCDALIAGIYGMNFEFMPELHWRFGYPLAIGLMMLISIGLVLFFRRRKWL
jgi:LPXTG-motif cell wall-anchored protein